MIVDKLGYVILNSPQYNAKAFGASISNPDNVTAFQNCINSSYRIAILGEDISLLYRHSQTLTGVSNKTIVINGNIKVADGAILNLEANALIGTTEITLTDASTYFKTGDYVCITSNGRAIQGGGNGKDRREGQPFKITVSGNTITLDSPCVYDYLVSESARIGHTHSSLNFEEKTNFKVCGSGILDENWENLLNVEPNSRLMELKQGYLHGAALMAYRCTNFEIKDVTLKNGLVYGFGAFYKNLNFIVDGVKIYDIHDKCIILYGYSVDINDGFEIKNCDINNAIYEDGITGYTQSTNGVIENNRIENCSRFGLLLNPTISNVIVRNNTVLKSGQALYVGNSTNTFEGVNTFEGYGYYTRSTANKRASVQIEGCNNGVLSGLIISQITKTAPLIQIGDSNGWVLDNLLLESTNDIALKITSTNPTTNTLQNSTLRGNATNYSLDANSTLIKINVTEE